MQNHKSDNGSKSSNVVERKTEESKRSNQEPEDIRSVCDTD